MVKYPTLGYLDDQMIHLKERKECQDRQKNYESQPKGVKHSPLPTPKSVLSYPDPPLKCDFREPLLKAKFSFHNCYWKDRELFCLRNIGWSLLKLLQYIDQNVRPNFI